MTRLSSFMSHRLAWPLITLLLLLALNTGFNASFLHIEWRDGHLYGSLIDILNRAWRSPVSCRATPAPAAPRG